MKIFFKRNVIRLLHIITGSIIATYIYSPWSESASFQFGVKAIVIPIIVLSGLWLWKGHLLYKKPSVRSKTLMIALMFFTFFTVELQAQETSKKPVKRFGVEMSPLGLGLFKITQFKGTYLLNPKSKFKSEIGVGFLFQPESDSKLNDAFNEDGLYSANMASLAYRQYFWKGLHFEEVVNFGNAKVKDNVIDGNDHKAFVIFSQTFLGYKFNVWKKENFSFFVIGQGGIGYARNTDQWPTKGNNTVYGLGDLKIGINF